MILARWSHFWNPSTAHIQNIPKPSLTFEPLTILMTLTGYRASVRQYPMS